jgi:hypothetical protein
MIIPIELLCVKASFAPNGDLRYYIAHNRFIQERGIEMPNFRKLEPEEVKVYQNKGKGLRKLTEEQYDAILADYEVGDYGEGTLEEGENRLTVRNRMKAAASRRGIRIDFRRTQGDLIRFKIIERSNGDGPAAAPPPVVSSEPPAPAKRKGGRPKKTA